LGRELALSAEHPLASDEMRISEPIEGFSINNPDVLTVTGGNDLLHNQRTKCTAEGGEGEAEIAGNARAIHRKIDFRNWFTISHLQMFLQFQEHCEPRRRSFLHEEKRMTLCLTEALAELDDDINVQSGIVIQNAA
jgi:hypothetical protein